MNAPSPCILRPGRVHRGGVARAPHVARRSPGGWGSAEAACGLVPLAAAWFRLGKPREQTGLWVPLTAPPHLPASGVLACTLGATVSLGTRPSVASRTAPASGLPITGYKGSGRLPRRQRRAQREGSAVQAGPPGPGGQAPGLAAGGRSCRPGPVLAPLLSPRARHRRLALSSVLSDGPLLGHPQTCSRAGGSEPGMAVQEASGPDTCRAVPVTRSADAESPARSQAQAAAQTLTAQLGGEDQGDAGRRDSAPRSGVTGASGRDGGGSERAWGVTAVRSVRRWRGGVRACRGRAAVQLTRGAPGGPCEGPGQDPHHHLGREKWGKQGQL